jgi:hypothetical protein
MQGTYTVNDATGMPAAQPKLKLRETSRAVFFYPKDAVWTALMESLTAQGFSPESMDKDSGTLFFKPGASWSAKWGDANYAVGLISTKQIRQMSSWQGVATTGNVFVKSLEPGESEVRVNLTLTGFNGFSGVWETLFSNGYVEDNILDGILQRLPERLPMPQVDTETAIAIREAVLLLQKVDAAFRLDAGRDEIMGRLIDAIAAVETNTPPSQGSLKIREILKSIADGYRKALDLTDAPRNLLLVECRSLLSDVSGMIEDRSSVVK